LKILKLDEALLFRSFLLIKKQDMSYTASIDQSRIKQWIDGNFDTQKIREEMTTLGYDSITMDAHLREFKKLKYGKRQTNGFIFLSVGAVLGFISCLLSIINPVPELYYYILYGLTSLSVIIICLGLYFLFE
jgi:hypothetical protein